MSTVLKVEEWAPPGDPDSVRWYVTLDDRSDNIPAYDPAAKSFVSGQPLPEGWTVTQSKAGKNYLKAPGHRASGNGYKGDSRGGGSWRNTEAGERFNAQQMNRRTALMQAVPVVDVNGTPETILKTADLFYDWLMSAGDVVVASASPAIPRTPSAGDWGEKVEAITSSSAPKVSEGGGVHGEGASSPLGQLSDAWGGSEKALQAAQIWYPTVESLSELSKNAINDLLAKARK